MKLERFISLLSERLREPLPGEEAQKSMAPEVGIENRFDLNRRKHARPGAVLILFYPHKETIYFPLIQRTTYHGVHSGQIGLPGGKRESFDTDLIETALRETEEEIGVRSDNINIIGSLTSLFIPVSNFEVLPVVGYSDEKPTFIPDNEEVEEVLPAPLQVLTEMQFQPQKEISIDQNFSITAPYFDLNGKTIWGATAMMLGELKSLLHELKDDLNQVQL